MISLSPDFPLRFLALVILLLVLGAGINLCLLGSMDAVKKFGRTVRSHTGRSHGKGEEPRHRPAA